MLELLVAITIVGLVLAVAVPASGRLYQTMQYREAVRDVVTLFASARYEAVNSGRAQDVRINPRTRELSLNKEIRRLPEGLNLVVRAARELNDQQSGVIRFYPEGGTSGGGVDVEIPGSYGVRVNVDWLVGRVSQQKYALD
jgi:general secretion pathway protein H